MRGPGVLVRFALENGPLVVHTQYAPKPEKFAAMPSLLTSTAPPTQKHDPFDLLVSALCVAPRIWQWRLNFERSPPIRTGTVEGNYYDAIKAGEEERLNLVYKGEDIWL